MNDLSSILIVIIALAVGLTAYLWRKLSLVEEQLSEQRGGLEDLRKDAEKARATAKAKGKEIDELRKKLQDTKAKLKRKAKDPSKGAPVATSVADEFGPKGSAAAEVHVGSQAVEARYEAKLSKLEKERDKAVARADKLQAAQDKLKAEKAAAKKALEDGGETGASPEAQVAALKDELAALRKEMRADKQKFEKLKGKSEGRERAATRRANANHAQYLVIKGQLELAEDKLATYRTRYEGAKPPAAFKPQPAANEDQAEEASAPAAKAPPAEAPAAEVPAEATPAVEEATAAVTTEEAAGDDTSEAAAKA